MKSILTVIGKDQVGIIAGISCELQKCNMNILNVTQTIMISEGFYINLSLMLQTSK